MALAIAFPAAAVCFPFPTAAFAFPFAAFLGAMVRIWLSKCVFCLQPKMAYLR